MPKTKPHYPGVTVELTNQDGNAFAVLGRVQRALKNGGVEQREIDRFTSEATSDGYDELLRACIRWVKVK